MASGSDEESIPTAPETTDVATERRGRWARRAGLAAFGLLVLLGLVGALGITTRTTSATGADGLRAELTYPVLARPGLGVPYRLVISRPAGFDRPIEVRVSLSYIEAFDENGFNPDPRDSTTLGDELIWTFDPPPGSSLTITFDSRVEPGLQWSRGGTTTVIVDDERLVLDHRVWILP